MPHIELPHLDSSLTIAAAAALIAGLARGFSGFGSALIFIPIGSATLGPVITIPLMFAMDIVLSVPLLPDAFRRAERLEVAIMAVCASSTVPLGVWLLTGLEPVVVRWAVAAVVLAALVVIASGWRFRGKPTLAASATSGALSGVLSGAVQLGGPPIVTYLLGRQDLNAIKVRATINAYFALLGLATGATYLWTGVLGRALIAPGLVIAPLYGIGMAAGARLFPLADEATFRRLSLALIALAALLSLPLWDSALAR